MHEVRRQDGECCGHVQRDDDAWVARTLLLTELGRHDTRAAAEAQVRAEGLAALGRCWNMRQDGSDRIQPVWIQEIGGDSVVVSHDPPHWPRGAVTRVARVQIASGAIRFEPVDGEPRH